MKAEIYRTGGLPYPLRGMRGATTGDAISQLLSGMASWGWKKLGFDSVAQPNGLGDVEAPRTKAVYDVGGAGGSRFANDAAVEPIVASALSSIGAWNGGAAVNWSSSTPDLFVVAPAAALPTGGGMQQIGVWLGPFLANNDWTDALHGSYMVGASQLVAWPVQIEQICKLDEIRIHCNAGNSAGREIGIGMYNSGADGEPLTLLASGNTDCSTTGVKSITGLDTLLTPGLHYLAARSTSNALQIYGTGGSSAFGTYASTGMHTFATGWSDSDFRDPNSGPWLYGGSLAGGLADLPSTCPAKSTIRNGNAGYLQYKLI